MNRNLATSLLWVTCMALFTAISSCDDKQHQQHAEKKVTYTCPMHPQIIQEKPGTCPICGMDLVVFDRTNQDKALTLDQNQRRLANIQTIVSGDTSMQSQKRLNGRIIVDPENTTVISSRVAGRLDNLYIRETGTKITKGQLLYRIYSEELASLQQEYLVAAAQKQQFPGDEQFSRIEQSAKQKLLLFGQTAMQVQELIRNNKPLPLTAYYSPVSGIVAEIMAAEGQYVSEGGTIMRVENYDDLWIEADVYAGEQDLVRKGMRVSVMLPGNAKPVPMEISFINPAFNTGEQVLKVRGKIPNSGDQYQPGMQVVIQLPSTGETMKSIPSSAVIRDGKGAHIWLETSPGRFEPRHVELGREDVGRVEVLQGLKNGEKVVVSGAYLLYSEFILKKGNGVDATHQH